MPINGRLVKNVKLMLERITPVIITYNEIDNIKRTLKALYWAKKIIIIDSFSDDGTLQYCQQQTNVELIQRNFDNFANQCNFALQQLTDEEWVLSLDADYVMTESLIKEIQTLNPTTKNTGFQVSFIYAINGNNLPGSLYPPRIVLYQRKHAQYQQDGHAHRVAINGEIGILNNKIIHDDRKPYQRWLDSQHSYALKEQKKIRDTAYNDLSWTDKIRSIPGLAPLLVIPYLLLFKGLIFSGKPGITYIKQRIQAEWILQKTLFFSR